MLQPVASAFGEQELMTCASCHQPLHHGDAQFGHPFITARQLASMAFHTIVRSPALFGEVMLKELPPVPYCAACRQQLPAKRQAEQMKVMVALLFVLALLIGLVLLFGTTI